MEISQVRSRTACQARFMFWSRGSKEAQYHQDSQQKMTRSGERYKGRTSSKAKAKKGPRRALAESKSDHFLTCVVTTQLRKPKRPWLPEDHLTATPQKIHPTRVRDIKGSSSLANS